MKYKHMVKFNGEYYPAGAEVPDSVEKTPKEPEVPEGVPEDTKVPRDPELPVNTIEETPPAGAETKVKPKQRGTNKPAETNEE